MNGWRQILKILGISGWSGCGKTTLIIALIPRLQARGLTVSILKHAHHDVDLDTPGKDTWRYREAGAQEIILATGQRWALLRELRGDPDPTLTELLSRLQPVDLALVEGWKTDAYPKLEIWRPGASDQPPRFPDDPTIIAVAADPLLDSAGYGRLDLPVFLLTDLEGIADFIIRFAHTAEPAI
jgi:molybdopterin-guanine dinucleotide biosynthesis protein B